MPIKIPTTGGPTRELDYPGRSILDAPREGNRVPYALGREVGPVYLIRVPGKPRPRHQVPIPRWYGNGRLVTVQRGAKVWPVVDLQLSSDSNRYQRAIARAAHLVIREQITASVRVDLVFVFARPKRLKQGPRALRGVRPDVDKLMRNVFDGLQRDAKGRKPPKRKPATGWPGVLADDSRVVSGTFLDCYAAFGEEPITEIRIVEVSDV